MTINEKEFCPLHHYIDLEECEYFVRQTVIFQLRLTPELEQHLKSFYYTSKKQQIKNVTIIYLVDTKEFMFYIHFSNDLLHNATNILKLDKQELDIMQEIINQKILT